MGTMRFFWLFLCHIVLLDAISALPNLGLSENSTTKDILKHLGMNAGFRRDRPGEASGQPVTVNVSIHLQNVRAVSEMDREIVYDMYFRSKWMDERMKYDEGPDYIIIHPERAESFFWFPDLFFTNAHDTTLHETQDINSAVRFQRDGKVLVSSRLSLRAHCDMDLSYFPHDTQQCGFTIESYMYTGDQIKLNITDISMADNANPPYFSILKCDKGNRQVVLSSGTYETVYVSLTLKRQSAHFVVVLFIPSLILVLLSCLVFWMPPYALMERTIYSVFLLLCMVPIITGSQANIPVTGYIKAIDIWVVASFVFLAVAVLEVIVLHLVFGRDLLAKTGETDRFELMRNEEPNPNNMPSVRLGPLVVRPDVAKKIDLGLRIAYPTAYVLFNAIYWGSYA